MVTLYMVEWLKECSAYIYVFLKFTIVGLQTIFKLLIILFVINLYARIDIYKF